MMVCGKQFFIKPNQLINEIINMFWLFNDITFSNQHRYLGNLSMKLLCLKLLIQNFKFMDVSTL
ncbi:unnamed protein product [Schistosoma rodhaini]|nr:unnamed protein product [Schistosoma rodhaini]